MNVNECLINLSDFIKTEMSEGKFVGMVVIDLQKAFDCVDHGLLIQKLSFMGVSSVDWFRSYLGGRKQCTNVAGIDSTFLDVTCGVPQGSILGPTLFLCYINELCASLNCRLSLYADDSALLVSGRDASEVARILSEELDTCRAWFVDNRLSFHPGKTECLLFGRKSSLGKVPSFEVKLGEVVVKRVFSAKYLGLTLDQHFDFSLHVEGALKKAAAKIHFLYRSCRFLDSNVKRMLAQSLVMSSLEYCSPAWYPGLKKGLRDRLDTMQR